MSVIIQLQNLPVSASSIDIREFFSGLSIPPGGVHIVGGKKGSAFIAFANDEDARQAMEKNGRRIKDVRIKLGLSSHRELKEVLEQLHKEQSEYEMSRKIRVLDSRSERNRSHQKHRRSRSRSVERRSRHEFGTNNQNIIGKYEGNSQRENPSNRQQAPYDRHGERKVQYADNCGREFLGTSGNDKPPNPYVPSTFTSSDPEEERNEEIRRRIETFIATFGQAENYNLDLKKDAYPTKAGKKPGHDGFVQPGAKETVHQNWSQGYPSVAISAETYPSEAFDDFDTRRRFDSSHVETTVSASQPLQGLTVPSVSRSFNPLREKNERMPYSIDGQNFSSQTNHSVLGDRLLNSPMDIEEDKSDSNNERFKPNQYLGPHMFSAPQEIAKPQGESASVSMGSASSNLLPFQSFENSGGDLRDVFKKSHPEVMSTDAAIDFCIKLEGLPYYATENDIRRVFRDQSIFDIFVPYTSDGKASGTGFVQFSSAEDLLTATKMKYCMIGESRVVFQGSSRAALMEARMPSVTVGSVANVETLSPYQDVLALKRTQGILSSMLSVRESVASASYPVLPPTFPPGSGAFPVVPPSGQQQTEPLAKRSLCAVITGLPSHFVRHIQVLRSIEEMGINFHLIHLVLNNRSRFTGKVFAEFHDLRDLDAALKKHNQNVEGCTIGVKQVLHEEMVKFLSSHPSRCMYPTPKQMGHFEKKPEKAPYIWEPPYEGLDKPLETDSPAVWSSKRAIENQRLAFNKNFRDSNSYGSDPYTGGSSYQKTESDLDIHGRMNTGNIYVGFSKANESPRVDADFFEGNSEMNFPVRENRDFVSARSREERVFISRKYDSSASQFSRDKRHERSRSPIDHGLRKDFRGDHKRFRNEQNDGENPEAAFLGSRSHSRHHQSQQKNQDIFAEKKEEFRKFPTGQDMGYLETVINIPVEKNNSKMKEVGSAPVKKRSSETTAPKSSTKSLLEESLKPKHEKEKVNSGKSSDTTSPKTPKKRFEHRKNCPKRQKNQHIEIQGSRPRDHTKADDLTRPDDHPRPGKRFRSSDRTRPRERSRSDDRSRPIDDLQSDDWPRRRNHSRSNEHLRSDDRVRSADRQRFDNCVRPNDRARLDDHSRPSNRSRPRDRSRHRTEQKEFRKEARDILCPEELFERPGCVLEATNVDPHLGLYELLDFFRGYGLHSENLIRRYTETGEPTSDLRIAFHHPEDAAQAHKILNRQYLKGRTVLLSFV